MPASAFLNRLNAPMDDPYVIGGTIINKFMIASNWISTVSDAEFWCEEDLIVDNRWIRLAVTHALLDGEEADYLYANQRHVSTMELERRAEVVFALNTARRIKYRITTGSSKRLGVLMKKTAPWDFTREADAQGNGR